MELHRSFFIKSDALQGLKKIESDTVDCIVTSPPYYKQRDYKVPGQIGQERDPGEYLNNLHNIMIECKRVIKPTGSIFINLGDKKKDHSLFLLPQRFAINCTDKLDLLLPQEIHWCKKNPIPGGNTSEKVCDPDFELLYHFVKSPDYIHHKLKEPSLSPPGKLMPAIKGCNRHRDGKPYVSSGMKSTTTTWIIATSTTKTPHIAKFPIEIPRRCIKMACNPDSLVLDPFMGSGTTGMAAERLHHRWVGIDLDKKCFENYYRNQLELELV